MMPTPCAAQQRDHLEEAVHLAVGERRGRLVQDQDPGVGADGLGDLDDLLLGHAERADQPLGIDVGARRAPAVRGRARRAPSNRPCATGRRVSSASAMFSATVRSGKSAGCW